MALVLLDGKRVSFNPSQAIGKGGEADIYRIGPKTALKIFKPPDHPDYEGQPREQQAARERLEIHQRKLQDLPRGLPSTVVTPDKLATDLTGRRVLGYSMPLVSNAEVLMRYGNRSFRSAVSNDSVVLIFRDLHGTVVSTHSIGVVIGDFNDLNVLVSGTEAYVIDADSFQWGPYPCRVFTARFVDPLLCDPKAVSPMLVRPHSRKSDWYAFSVMLMQSLLFVDPYGGVYKPKNPNNRVPHSARPLHRITVFHPDVVYPKPAVPYNVLPDEMLQWFHLIFEKDMRGDFPLKILEDMRWTNCSNCGTEHARAVCPNCTQVMPEAVKEVTKVRGQVTATRAFRTRGLVLFAAFQDGKLRFLYHEDGKFKREDGSVVISGAIDPLMRFRIKGDSTLVAQGSRVITLTPGQKSEVITVDSFGTLPIFDANERFRYWIISGQLLRDGALGPEYIGDILTNQTLFWVGPTFGFGFYRAGNLSVTFTFDAERRGINDSIKLPPIKGQLVDSTCVFTRDRCWFFVSSRQGSKTINQCIVLKRDGAVEGSAEAEDGDGSWLGAIRGKMATNNFLLAATDEGIVRVEPTGNGQITKTREFPDTEPFVDSGCHIFPGPGGLYVINQKEVWLLKIS